MKLDIRPKCQLAILVAAAMLSGERDDQQLTSEGFHRALGRTGVAADRARVESWLADFEAAGWMAKSPTHHPVHGLAWRITELGLKHIGSYRDEVDSTLDFIMGRTAAVMNEQAPVEVRVCPGTEANAVQDSPDEEWEENESASTMCLSEPALDWLWNQLADVEKADALSNYFEYRSALDQPVPPLTEAGPAAVEGR